MAQNTVCTHRHRIRNSLHLGRDAGCFLLNRYEPAHQRQCPLCAGADSCFGTTKKPLNNQGFQSSGREIRTLMAAHKYLEKKGFARPLMSRYSKRYSNLFCNIWWIKRKICQEFVVTNESLFLTDFCVVKSTII